MKQQPSIWIAALGGVGALSLLFALSHRPEARAERPAEVKEATYAPKAKGTITYTRDIAPILFANCSGCHRPGEVAPFPLLAYQDAQKRAAQLATVTQSKYMPPWKPDTRFSTFKDTHILTAEQIGTLKQWAEEGAKEGNPKDLPAAPKFAAGWTIGAPDAIFEPAKDYPLTAEGSDVYRCFVVPTSYTEDRYISTIDVRPGNRAVVHHLIAYLDTSGKARQMEAASSDGLPGFTAFGGLGFAAAGTLGGWAPGSMPHPLPEGVGILLPKGADIVLQVHYHKSGKPETDRTKIGVYFCKGPVDKRARMAAITSRGLRIPADEANYEAAGSQEIKNDITVLQVAPHMHLIGHDMTVTATLPGGDKKPLIRIPDWDFNWQGFYTLQDPLKLPGGSTVNMVAHFDNSTRNPRNPNSPPKRVTWGEQTTNEMCIAFALYTVDSEHLTKGIVGDNSNGEFGRRGARLQRLRQLLGGNRR